MFFVLEKTLSKVFIFLSSIAGRYFSPLRFLFDDLALAHDDVN